MGRGRIAGLAIFVTLIVVGTAGYGLLTSSERPPAEIAALDRGPLRAAYLVRDARAAATTIHLIVQAGEIDDDGTEGLAHYVEHLAWMTAIGPRGAPDRHSNAWTSQLATVFWLKSGNDPGAIAGSLARVLGPIDLTRAFMVEERGIVARERDYRVGSVSPERMARADAMTAFLHADDPRRRSVLGTATQIGSFRPEDAMALHDRLYRPSRCVLLIAGDLSVAAAERLVAAAFGDLPRDGGPSPALVYVAAPVVRDARSVVMAGASGGEVHYGKVVALAKAQEPAQLVVALDLLYAILDSRLPGSLAAPLRYDAKLARGYDLSLSVLDGSHVEMAFDADPDRDVTAARLLDAFEKVMAGIAADGIPSGTFERIHARAIRDLEGVDDRAAFDVDRALLLLQMRQPPEGHSRTLERLRGLDVADMDRLVSALAGPGRVFARTIEP